MMNQNRRRAVWKWTPHLYFVFWQKQVTILLPSGTADTENNRVCEKTPLLSGWIINWGSVSRLFLLKCCRFALFNERKWPHFHLVLKYLYPGMLSGYGKTHVNGRCHDRNVIGSAGPHLDIAWLALCSDLKVAVNINRTTCCHLYTTQHWYWYLFLANMKYRLFRFREQARLKETHVITDCTSVLCHENTNRWVIQQNWMKSNTGEINDIQWKNCMCDNVILC